MNKGSTYNDDCLEQDSEGSLQSARIIVPILLRLVDAKRVIDVGCGRGAWLTAFRENGIKVVKGLDGPWGDKSKLLIPEEDFTEVDFTRQIPMDSQYDLATCLEVAEHLPLKMSSVLVKTLVKAAPAVLFSAAIPGQTGINHINEQWPPFWEELFAQHGFQRLDPIRRQIWNDSRVNWWYRQNILLYVSTDAIARSAILSAEARIPRTERLELIHERILFSYTTPNSIPRQFPRPFTRLLKERIYWPLVRRVRN